MIFPDFRGDGDGVRKGDDGEGENVVGYANYTLQKLGIIVGWRWQNMKNQHLS